MTKIDVHLKESLDRTGKGYKELHEWIDDPSSKPKHHDITKIYKHAREVEEKWGEEAAQDFINHIQTDVKAQVSRNWGCFWRESLSQFDHKACSTFYSYGRIPRMRKAAQKVTPATKELKASTFLP